MDDTRERSSSRTARAAASQDDHPIADDAPVRHRRIRSSQASTTSSLGAGSAEEDSEFLDALAALPLTQFHGPKQDDLHHLPQQSSGQSSGERKKRKARFEDDPVVKANGSQDDENEEMHPSTGEVQAQARPSQPEYLDSAAYEALPFGDFATYMRNKRAKLKVQEASLKEQEEALLAAANQAKGNQINVVEEGSTIFAKCTMYINGHTVPPYAELRRLIILHGGDFMAYLDQKGPVTHIIASNLTPKKRVEFADYRVVRPEWIMDSIKAGKRLAWQDYKVEGDAGGAIGSEKLPQGKALPSFSQRAPQEGFLASKPAMAADGVKGPSAYLADATPWGRATAQRKLASFRGQKRQDVEPAQNDTKKARKLQQLAAFELGLPSLDKDDVMTDGEGTMATRELTPPPSNQLTQEEKAWLGSLDTPPRAKVDDSAIAPAPPEPSDDTSTSPAKTLLGGLSSAKDAESALGTDPVSRAGAVAAGHFKSNHPYTKRPSNEHAARLLNSPTWREENTATSESFLSGFFAKSRLHYLSTWKGELKDLVSQALRDAGRGEGSQPLPRGVPRVIMHIDFDSFFVSVGLRNRPDLIDKPVVVCHAGSDFGGGRAGESSTSEIASCNYVARKFGIHNGWSLGRARQLCPHVECIPYDFEGYKDVSIQFYSLMLLYADAVEAVSVDEGLIDVSLLLQSMRENDVDSATEQELTDERRNLMLAYKDHTGSQGDVWSAEKRLAEAFRDEIRNLTRCEASIGIGANTLQARLATRHAKPGGSYHLTEGELEDFINKLDIDDLQGVGWHTRQRFETVFNTCNIGELKAKASEGRISAEMGPKLGKTLWQKMHGIDRAELEGAKQRGSVGAAVNYGIRFIDQEEAEKFFRNLAQEVSNRLAKHKLRSRHVNVTVMVRDPEAPVEAPKFLGHGICDVHQRGAPMLGPGGTATNDVEKIFQGASKLIKSLGAPPSELRGIGISCTKLEPIDNVIRVPQPKAGQSLLNFAPVRAEPTTPSKSSNLQFVTSRADHETYAEDSDDDEHGGIKDDEPELMLTPGPMSQKKTPRSTVKWAPEDQSQGSQGRADQEDADISIPLRGTRARSLEPTPSQSMHQGEEDQKASPTPISGAGGLRRNVAAPSFSFALPTMSQMDPSVLNELPPSIRAEVLRESRRLGSSSSSSTKMFPAKQAPLLRTSNTMARSLSASPSKRQLAARKTQTTLFGAGGAGAGGGSGAMSTLTTSSPSRKHAMLPFLPPNQPRVTKAHIQAMDPSSMTAAELQALEIDPDVFAALPLSLQRETLISQARQIKGRESRFVGSTSGRGRGGGVHDVERTLKDEREWIATKAAQASTSTTTRSKPSTEPISTLQPLQATPYSHTPPLPVPTMQKRSSPSSLRTLLTQWTQRHANRRPRDNDVKKFSAFLQDSISGVYNDDDGGGGGSTTFEEVGKRASLRLRLRPGSGRDSLELVSDLLKWWEYQLACLVGSRPRPRRCPRRRPRPGRNQEEQEAEAEAEAEAEGEGKGQGEEGDNVEARVAWWAALDRVRADVDAVVKRRFGGRLG